MVGKYETEIGLIQYEKTYIEMLEIAKGIYVSPLLDYAYSSNGDEFVESALTKKEAIKAHIPKPEVNEFKELLNTLIFDI